MAQYKQKCGVNRQVTCQDTGTLKRFGKEVWDNGLTLDLYQCGLCYAILTELELE